MSTFLEICKAVHRKLRIGDYEPGSQPSTVTGQTGDLGDVVESVKEAWLQLQMHHRDWRWMRSGVSVTLTANVNIITVANFQAQNSRFAHVLFYTAQSERRYANIRGDSAITNPEMQVWFIPWQEFSGGLYTRTPAPTAAQPMFFSEQPNRSVRLYPAPNTPSTGGNWLFSIPCRLTPQDLTADGTIPEMPAEFHNIIVWWAVDVFCRTRTNFDRLSAEAKKEVNRQLDKLAADQLPEMVECPPYV